MNYYIIPEPYRMVKREGVFYFDYDTEIVLDANCTEKEFGYAKLLAETVKEQTGFELHIRKGEPDGQNEIYIERLPEAVEMPENVRSLLEQDKAATEWVCPDAETEKAWKIRTESYYLEITPEQVVISAEYAKGILYAIQTLRQLVNQCKMVLPCLEIEDKPALANRGFYHDATRGRVRKLEDYKKLADKLSYYKQNQLQLYVEHSYLFRDLTEVWRDDTPLTAEEIMELDGYCKNIGIELVPSMATFGHLDKLLQAKRFAPLCELEGSDTERFTFRGRMEHHTINPADDGALDVIRELLLEFMPLFSSRQFNLCGDETFDLGKGRSKALAEEIGLQKMYVDFVKKICNVITENGCRPMFWGDVIKESPELLSELPESVICLTWGYSEEEKEDSAKAMHGVGAVQYLCPGVHGWRHLMNRLPSAYANVSKMCEYANRYQALGLLNTDWGDYGHLSQPEFSVPGLIYGAQGAWSGNVLPEDEINRRISKVEFDDKAEQIVGLLSQLSLQEGAGWGPMVDYMERMTEGAGLSVEEQKGLFASYIPLNELAGMNREITGLLKRIGENATGLSENGRKNLSAYFLYAHGQQIFNAIVSVLAVRALGFDVELGEWERDAAEQPELLAAELERWFYAYKNLWRNGSKESELYRVQNVIFWYADLLRNME